MGVSAPLLLETADAFISTGLRDANYTYINTDDGWLDLNRTASGQLQPSATFTNASMRALTDALKAKGFRFGICTRATSLVLPLLLPPTRPGGP